MRLKTHSRERDLSTELLNQIEQLIRRDPANRGLIGSEATYGPLCVGHFAEAVIELTENATEVGLLTGFYVPHGEPPAAETDGPPGTLMLACALECVGIEVTLITDQRCLPAIRAAAAVTGFNSDRLALFPDSPGDWPQQFFTTGAGKQLTHLISIERPGPSHTEESLAKQARNAEPPLQEFKEKVPETSYDRCHNMRGVDIDEHAAPAYQLFDELQNYRPLAKSIGIGDGGNEIGMGTVSWEELHRRLEGEHSARIPCRIATDWTILAGVSNWGGYALAAGVLLLRNQLDLLRNWDADRELSIIQHIVQHGPAVDGITARAEATVDGLPFTTYIQPWNGIRRLLDLE